MPVQACQLNGKPGFKWGTNGRCYTYTPDDEASREAAKALAARQGRAVETSQHRDDNADGR